MNGKNGLPGSLQVRLLSAIIDFMHRSGLSEAEIHSSFRACLDGFATGSKGMRDPFHQDERYVGNGNVSAELIRLWTRDSRYMDRDARPKPLPLSRGRNSLVSLIRRLDPVADPYSTIESMRTVGLIRELPTGRFVPTAESVTIDRLHPLAVEHVAKSLIRLVTTVCRNTDPSRHTMPLIEKYAYVPDLSKSEMKDFADFTRTQGMAYLEAVDDWLQQRRVGMDLNGRKSRGQCGVAAGVHLVAYLGDPVATSHQLACK